MIAGKSEDLLIRVEAADEPTQVNAKRRQSANFAGEGLTVTQFGVMEALHHLGPMHQRKIGLKLLKSGGNVTMVIDNLERRKLVERRRDRKDRRFVNVHLTPAGIKLISKVFPQRVASVKEEMNRLTASEQEELGRLCRILGVGSES